MIPGVFECPIELIVYDDSTRQRRELDEAGVLELARSIESIQLMNPIIVEPRGEGKFDLRAGRRRLEAFKILKHPKIPARIFHDLSPLDRMIVEFDENHKRRQLSWQEESAAIAKIHEIRASMLGPNEKPLIADTAKLLGVSDGKVFEDLQLAKSLTNDRVACRPTRRGALQTLKRERELELLRELARRRAEGLGISEGGTTLGGGHIYNMDCRELLATMPENVVDLIVTDPPWGVNFDQAAFWTKDWLKTFEDGTSQVQELMTNVFPHLFHVLKPCCHLYCFVPIQEMSWWIDRLEAVGFVARHRPLIWFKKGNPSMTDLYTCFRPAYEAFIFAYKPPVARLFNGPIADAMDFPRQPTEFHENSKPVEMLERYIEASSNVNDIVLDPFCGGGSTLVAAFQTGRYYIGVEKDEVHFGKCVKRLQDLEAEVEESAEEGKGD